MRTTLVIETPMMNVVKEKMPVNASFFLTSIDAFQRMFIDIRMTCALSDSALRPKIAPRSQDLLRPSVVVSNTVASRR